MNILVLFFWEHPSLKQHNVACNKKECKTLPSLGNIFHQFGNHAKTNAQKEKTQVVVRTLLKIVYFLTSKKWMANEILNTL